MPFDGEYQPLQSHGTRFYASSYRFQDTDFEMFDLENLDCWMTGSLQAGI